MMPKPRVPLFMGAKRLPGVRRVTAVIGYTCDSGIVLCADTQETIPGYTKTDANKLLPFECHGLNLVFAGAGNNATQVDEAAYEVAAQVIADEPRNNIELKRSVREALEELFPKSHYPRGKDPEVDLLMAVQWKTETFLFRIADCNMAPVRKMAALGSGVILAAQLLQRHYDRKVQVSEAAIICIYVMYHVKKFVDGCGGNTDIAIISRATGTMAFMPSVDVEKFEKYSNAYDDAVKGLLLAVPRSPKNLGLFDQEIEAAKNGLRMARTAFQEMEDTMREVAAHLGMNYEEFVRQSEEGAEAMLKAAGIK
ncbi:MAG TPA: hypothetical protein VGM02_10190 [Acidobacteriaceae bacterium]|jgi:20S proteasome alpha/beta subunit